LSFPAHQTTTATGMQDLSVCRVPRHTSFPRAAIQTEPAFKSIWSEGERTRGLGAKRTVCSKAHRRTKVIYDVPRDGRLKSDELSFKTLQRHRVCRTVRITSLHMPITFNYVIIIVVNTCSGRQYTRSSPYTRRWKRKPVTCRVWTLAGSAPRIVGQSVRYVCRSRTRAR